MTDLYFWVRIVNFVLAFLLWFIMIYAKTNLVVERLKYDADETHKLNPYAISSLAWLAVLMYSTAEVLFEDSSGGARVFVITGVLILQSWAVWKADHVYIIKKRPVLRFPRRKKADGSL